MVHFAGQDLGFEVPGDWDDRSVTAFSAPPRVDVPIAPNIVVTRDVAADAEPVTSYADRQLVEMARRLDAFHLLSRQEGIFGGLPSVRLIFTWRGAAGVLRQSQIFVIRGDTVLSFVLTALESEFQAQEGTFNAILRTVVFD
jgi:hypothetical protein